MIYMYHLCEESGCHFILAVKSKSIGNELRWLALEIANDSPLTIYYVKNIIYFIREFA